MELIKPSEEVKPIYVWFDAGANFAGLARKESLVKILDKCLTVGIKGIIVDVKHISGLVLYPSEIAPRLLEWQGGKQSPDYDLLKIAVEAGHKRGLQVLAGMNLFSEGHRMSKLGRVYTDKPDWQCWEYLAPEGMEPGIYPSLEYGQEAAIFVSPHNPEVINYELSIMKEIFTMYPELDGLCLDRVRFLGISADFSPLARAKFEEFMGHRIENFPEDIYKLVKKEAGWERVPGKYFQPWLYWRALTIRRIIERARAIVKSTNPRYVFADYAGSWYPIYYELGVNWASSRYSPHLDYHWALPEYSQTGYAEVLDSLFSGFYYYEVTEQEAIAKGNPEWQSVEGSGKIVSKVVQGTIPVIGSLYLFQYRGNPEQFKRAMRMAYNLSDGLMLFDLVYLEDYQWWDEVRDAFTSPR